MKIRGSAIALLALLAGACSTGTDSVPRENYGIVFVETQEVEAGYVVNPTATFFSSPQLSFNTSVQSADACVVADYDADAEDVLPNLRFLNAGEELTATLSGETRTLTRVVEANETETYEIESGGGIVFDPGDTLQLSAPGADDGFPDFSIRARTAEAFDFTEPEPPAAGEPLVLDWTPRPVPGSTMLVSLRYASTGSTLDTQVYCDLVDDGDFTIAASQINGWRLATTRENVFTRWRTEVRQLNENSYVVVSSTLSIPTPGSGPTLARALGRISTW
jgi:hypothetical protein